MTKKEKILKLFEDADWLDIAGTWVKIIGYDDFLGIGLNQTIEYGEKYCDVIYARRIIQSMGYRVLIATNFNIYKK